MLRSPGANKGPAQRAWRAADNSPWCTSCLARCACGFGLVLLVSAVMGWEPLPRLKGCDPCSPDVFGEGAGPRRSVHDHSGEEEPKLPGSCAALWGVCRQDCL